MNYIFFAVKNSYLIYILLKNSRVFLEWFFTIFYTILLKKKNTKIDLKIGTKSSDWKFYRDLTEKLVYL